MGGDGGPDAAEKLSRRRARLGHWRKVYLMWLKNRAAVVGPAFFFYISRYAIDVGSYIGRQPIFHNNQQQIVETPLKRATPYKCSPDSLNDVVHFAVYSVWRMNSREPLVVAVLGCRQKDGEE